MVSSEYLTFKGHCLWHLVQSDSSLIFYYEGVYDLQYGLGVGKVKNWLKAAELGSSSAAWPQCPEGS